MSVIVIEFITLDGVVGDPNGADGSPTGGWAFRHGPETVAGDKFQLGETLDRGSLLIGRKTWQLFSGLFPLRDDPFSTRMNAVPKLVVTRTLSDLSAWENSQLLEGDLLETVRQADGDLIVPGSLSVVSALMAADLIDEYRLLTFPTIAGSGRRLFDTADPSFLSCESAELAGAAVLTRYLKE